MRMHTASNQRMWRDSLSDCITAMCSWIRSQQWSIQLPTVWVPHIYPPPKQSNTSEIGEGTFTCIYNWFCLKTRTIYDRLNILPSGIWIQSKEFQFKGAELRVFDCVLLLCYPGCKHSDSLLYFLSKSSRSFQCTWHLLPLLKKWYWSIMRSKQIWELHKSSTLKWLSCIFSRYWISDIFRLYWNILDLTVCWMASTYAIATGYAGAWEVE